MAKKSQKRQQDKALKKRRKAKARAQQQQKAKLAAQPQNYVRRAREFPIQMCWITPGWDNKSDPGAGGLVTVVITREQPDGSIVFGSYLLDVFCLGLKDTMFHINVPPAAIEEEVLPHLYRDGEPEKCTPELAHQIVYQAIDYAGQFGFKPQRDFKYTRYVLDPRGTYEETHELTFGKDGQPLFIAGPYDNVDRIIAQLNKTAGMGNFAISLPMMDLPFGGDDDWGEGDIDEDEVDEDAFEEDWDEDEFDEDEFEDDEE
jgi:hypothetical protein